MARRSLLLSVLVVLLINHTAWAEEPQYGGNLNVGTVNVTLSPLSWDPRRLDLEEQSRHRCRSRTADFWRP